MAQKRKTKSTMIIRRRSWRKWPVMLGVFVAVFLFTFLTAKFKGSDDADAANLGNFDAGYIISDYQMGNYNSMSESEIWNFLKQKGNCNDTRIYLADYYTSYSYHIKDGHFVCLADETFGNGTAYGNEAPNGESAAHIIWQAAQDYRINPQVLIVLLQKEQGLITDSWPNNRQYRSATGYGCPDTAPCNSEYYGFKNQVRKAAALFRTVLDGGWTNYPLGWNYVQYNPDSGCGGSWVDIRSLGTSALYRYTPYQPNASALAAGYGTGDYCGAYGNRNFYSYFEDWFGGITSERVSYVPMETPRYLEINKFADRINPKTGGVVSGIEKGRILRFESKAIVDGKSCLRTEYGTFYNEDICIMVDDLDEIKLEYEIIPEGQRKMIILGGAKKIYIRGEKNMASFNEDLVREVVAKTSFNGNDYYITSYDYENTKSEYGFLRKDVKEYIAGTPEYYLLDTPKTMVVIDKTERINPFTKSVYDNLEKNIVYTMSSAISLDGVKYYRTKYNTENNIDAVIEEGYLEEVSFVWFDRPREMKINRDIERLNPITGEVFDILENGRIIRFATKILINDKWFYRTENNTLNNLCLVVPEYAVSEVSY